MTNKELARHLKQTAQLIDLTGGNSFRSRAFQNGARIIERLEVPASELLQTEQLQQMRGIGSGLAGDITSLLATGSFPLLDELLATIPPGLHEVLRIKGLGAKKVRALWQTLDITTIDELEHVAQTNQLSQIKGFGAKTQSNILEQIALLRTYNVRRRYASVYEEVQTLLMALCNLPNVEQAEATGDFRRQLDTVSQVEILVAGTQPESIRAFLQSQFLVSSETPNDVLFAGQLSDGLPLRVYFSEPEKFGTTLWKTTGSTSHYATFTKRFGIPNLHAEENQLFIEAGLDFIPPALREGAGELDAALTHSLPQLIQVEDLHGSLHNHSTYSDGAHTLRQMAERTRAMGLSYFGICDHSQSLTVAHGLPIAKVRAQQEEIKALNAEFATDGGPAFRIFSGIESDILRDGTLDYPDEVLASFDFVVASVHSGFNMTEAQATERILRAIENPYTRILGHPTGRLLLVREGYPVDHEQIIAGCATHGVAIELNANPYRLDLDWRWIHKATKQGVLISINPDAHSMDQLALVSWGVAVAQKGWLTPAGCLNAKSLPEFSDWIAEGRPT